MEVAAALATRPSVGRPLALCLMLKRKSNAIQMSLLNLIKATVVCGLIAFLVYSIPVIGQIVLIGILGLLWLSCARLTFQTLRRRWFG